MKTNCYPYASPKHLWDVVGKIYDAWFHTKQEPGAEKWAINRFYRAQMLSAVMNEWVADTHQAFEDFPFNDDFVDLLWIDYRKLTKENKDYARKMRGK